jgi:hypothetical protein
VAIAHDGHETIYAECINARCSYRDHVEDYGYDDPTMTWIEASGASTNGSAGSKDI